MNWCSKDNFLQPSCLLCDTVGGLFPQWGRLPEAKLLEYLIALAAFLWAVWVSVIFSFKIMKYFLFNYLKPATERGASCTQWLCRNTVAFHHLSQDRKDADACFCCAVVCFDSPPAPPVRVLMCPLKQSGGFYSAEDADSVPASGGPEKREGAFCVWTASEVRELLPDVVEGASGGATQADIFMHHYGVKEQGNVAPEQVLWSHVQFFQWERTEWS